MGHCAASRPADSQPLVGTPLVSLQLRPAPAGCQSNAAGERGGQTWRASVAGAEPRSVEAAAPARMRGSREAKTAAGRNPAPIRRRARGNPGGPASGTTGTTPHPDGRGAAEPSPLPPQGGHGLPSDCSRHGRGPGEGASRAPRGRHGAAAAARSDTAASRPAFRFLRKSRAGVPGRIRALRHPGRRPTDAVSVYLGTHNGLSLIHI